MSLTASADLVEPSAAPRADLRPALGAGQLDALVAVSLENVYYASSVPLMTQRLIPSRLAFVVTTPDGTSMIACSIELAQVRAESWISDIHGYAEFKESPTAVLADLLRKKGLARSRIGVESTALGYRYYAELRQLLPDATLVDADEVFLRARAIKSPYELAVYRDASMATDAAIRATFMSARMGETELLLAERLENELRTQGADGVAFTVLATGANAHMAHPSPGRARVANGVVLRTDFGGYFGARYAGYMTDLARTAVAGVVSEAQRTTYDRLFEVHDTLLRALQPGVRACDIFDLARREFEERGLSFQMPHVGHSIGLAIHEAPMLNPMTTTELQEGMVLAIEPITITDDGIFHVEDLVVITADGSRLLSPAYDWTELVSVG